MLRIYKIGLGEIFVQSDLMFSHSRIIDLSVPFVHQAAHEPLPPSIRYVEHHPEGAQMMREFFGMKGEDLVLSEGQGWALEEINAVTHTGTHVDAPYHYHPTSEGKPAKRIDEVPLERCFAPGVVLDVRHIPVGEEITAAHLQGILQNLNYTLNPLDIVLLRTDCDKLLNSKEYFEQPGLGREGTVWLCDQGIKMIGIDAYTVDRPFAAMKADYERTGDGRHIWPAHFAGIEREYCQIEKLANLDQLPPYGFTVSCLPVKIEKASAGWCRAVAILPAAKET